MFSEVSSNISSLSSSAFFSSSSFFDNFYFALQGFRFSGLESAVKSEDFGCGKNEPVVYHLL